MRAAIALALLASLVLLIWLFTARGGEPTTIPARDAAGDRAVQVRDATDVAVEPTPPTTQQVPAPEPERHSVEASFPGPSAVLRVVRFGTGEAIPHARVLYERPDFDWQKLSGKEQAELSRLGRDAESRLERTGETAIADGEGRCRVPLGKRGTRVCARDGEWFGDGYVRIGDEGEQMLTLRIDCTLRGLVVDAGGQPAAGVPVQLTRSPKGPSQLPLGVGDTDAAGRFEWIHLQTLAGDSATRTLEVRALLPGATSEVVQIEATAPPPEVVLHLPRTGSVTVHVRDLAGHPIDPTYLGDATVALMAFDHEPSEREEADAVNRQNFKADIGADGDAVFTHVALDRHLVAKWSLLERIGFDGPTDANPHVEVTLKEHAEDAILTGTVLLPDGSPFADRELRVEYRADRGSGGQAARTDARGRMRCDIGGHVDERSAVIALKTPPLERDDPLAIELPPRSFQAGINDLGDVRLEPFRVLLAGRIVPDDGVEVRKVRLDFSRRGGGGWNQEHNLYPEWQPDGTFMVRSAVPAGAALRVTVGDGPYLPVAPIECTAGDTGIEIPLRAAGEAVASFVVGELVPWEHLKFRLRRTDAAETFDPRQLMMERFADLNVAFGNGRLTRTWKGLTPGTYRLTAACLGVDRPVATIDAVLVGPRRCDDPRLVDIDLRGRVRALEIRATDASGEPIADPDACVVIRDPGKEWSGFNLGRGVAKLAVPGAVDLFVLARGYECARLESVVSSHTVMLQPAVETSIRVELPSPLPDGSEIVLRLEPKLDLPKGAQITLDTGRGTPLHSYLIEEVAVGGDGTAIAPARWPGEYTVTATLSTRTNGRMTVRGFEPGSIELPAPGGLTLSITKENFDALLQALRR